MAVPFTLGQITPDWLKKSFLFGVPLVDSQGNPIDLTALQYALDAATGANGDER